MGSAARAVAPRRDTRRLERLVRWRIPGVAHGQTYDELFRAYPFTLLDEGDTLVGLRACAGGSGRSRATTRASPGPEDFRDWDERGTVRVLFAHWAEPGDGRRASWFARRASTRSTRRRGCGCARCGR